MPLTPELNAWITAQVGTIEQATQLAGSTSTTLYRIKTEQTRYVLRLYDNQEWLATEPDLCEHEAHALMVAQSAKVRTPNLIAYEPDASVAGVAVLLMSHLDGDVWLTPTDMNDWLQQAADALAKIHQLTVPDFQWQHFRYVRQNKLRVPTWTDYPQVWQSLIDLIQQPEPDTPQHFIHRDYHQTNFLWQNGKLTGVVDWINACIGVAHVDVGHMRVNLALLYSVETADAFLRAYQRANPAYEYHPYWDAMTLIDATLYDDQAPSIYRPWLDFGITNITDEAVQERTEQLAQAIASQI